MSCQQFLTVLARRAGDGGSGFTNQERAFRSARVAALVGAGTAFLLQLGLRRSHLTKQRTKKKKHENARGAVKNETEVQRELKKTQKNATRVREPKMLLRKQAGS
jgi:hypothetical protein